jgi:hypothetical protein
MYVVALGRSFLSYSGSQESKVLFLFGQCPMPNAPCPMPHAQCPVLPIPCLANPQEHLMLLRKVIRALKRNYIPLFNFPVGLSPIYYEFP